MVSPDVVVLIGNSEMYFGMRVDVQMFTFTRLVFVTRSLQQSH